MEQNAVVYIQKQSPEVCCKKVILKNFVFQIPERLQIAMAT